MQTQEEDLRFVCEQIETKPELPTDLRGFGTKEEAEKKASQYPGRTAILSPSKAGEQYRVTLYQGLKELKEIKVIDEWLVQHPS